MGPQRSGAIVLEVTCVPVQRSNGAIETIRDLLVNQIVGFSTNTRGIGTTPDVSVALRPKLDVCKQTL